MSKRSNDIRDATCEIACVHKGKVNKVLKRIGSDEDLAGLAEIFNALGDTTRVKILRALSIEELCVCDLAAIVGLSQSAISHQLRFLRISRLVKFRKDGKMAYYSLDDDHVLHLIDEGLRHAREGR